MRTLFTSLDALRRAGTTDLVPAGWPTGYEGKRALFDAGPRVRALRYQRASEDQYGERYSVTSQENMNSEMVARHCWTDADTFTDNDISGSRDEDGQIKERPEYDRLLDAIRAGAGDVLVIVELPRAQRDLAVYTMIRDLCRASGLHFWCIGGSIYDLRDRHDRQSLGMQAVQAEGQSDAIKEGTLRGLKLQADDGRPHGATLFGYVRSYKPASGKFAEQVLDTEEYLDTDGNPWTAAGIVQAIFSDYLAGVPARAIAVDLTRRAIPVPRLHAAQRIGHPKRIEKWQNKRWRDTVIKHILTNPAYIGKRMHKGALSGDGRWPGLITEKQFFSAARKMAGSNLRGERSTAVRWLLSCLAKCAVCGDDMVRRPPTRRQKTAGQGNYLCKQSCASVPVVDLETYVYEWLLAEIARPEMAEANSRVTPERYAQCSATVARAQQALAEVKVAFADKDRPWVDQAAFDAKAAVLYREMAEAEEVLYGGLPPAVVALMGPDAAVKWALLSLAQKRDIIRTAADIRVRAAGRGRRNVPMAERVTLRNRLLVQEGDQGGRR